MSGKYGKYSFVTNSKLTKLNYVALYWEMAYNKVL